MNTNDEIKVEPDWLLERLSSFDLEEIAGVGIRHEGLTDDEAEGMMSGALPVLQAHGKSFLSKAQPEDQLWFFSTPDDTWRNETGCAGFVILRDGEQAATWITLRS